MVNFRSAGYRAFEPDPDRAVRGEILTHGVLAQVGDQISAPFRSERYLPTDRSAVPFGPVDVPIRIDGVEAFVSRNVS